MEILEGNDKWIKRNLKEIIKTNENKEEVYSELNRELDMVELEREIKKLKRKKAPGPDGIPNEFYKMLRREVMEELLKMVNKI